MPTCTKVDLDATGNETSVANDIRGSKWTVTWERKRWTMRNMLPTSSSASMTVRRVSMTNVDLSGTFNFNVKKADGTY